MSGFATGKEFIASLKPDTQATDKGKGPSKTKGGKLKENRGVGGTEKQSSLVLETSRDAKERQYSILVLSKVATPLSSQQSAVKAAASPLQSRLDLSWGSFASSLLCSPKTPNRTPLAESNQTPPKQGPVPSVCYAGISRFAGLDDCMPMSCSPQTPRDSTQLREAAFKTSDGSPMDISSRPPSSDTIRSLSRFAPDESGAAQTSSHQAGDAEALKQGNRPTEAVPQAFAGDGLPKRSKRRSSPNDNQNRISPATREYLNSLNESGLSIWSLSQPQVANEANPQQQTASREPFGAEPIQSESPVIAARSIHGTARWYQPSKPHQQHDDRGGGQEAAADGSEPSSIVQQGMRQLKNPEQQAARAISIGHKQRWAERLAMQNSSKATLDSENCGILPAFPGHPAQANVAVSRQHLDQETAVRLVPQHGQQLQNSRILADCNPGNNNLQAARPKDAVKIYRPFARQQEAIDFAAQCNAALSQNDRTLSVGEADAVKVWCEERKGIVRGQTIHYRSFLAASYAAFWNSYKQLAAHARHCYEVIQQDRPCHLYLDLEYSKPCNPGLDGDEAVEALIKILADAVNRYWEHLTIERNDVIELSSDTSEKFSRHLIIRLPGHAFESNAAAGSFVNRVMARPEASKLTVKKSFPGADIEEFTSLVDTGVYTKNRHFRVVWSSKGGKQAILEVTDRFSRLSNEALQHQFLHSLVCNVDPSCQLLSLDPTKLNSRGMIRASGDRGCLSESSGGHGDISIAHKYDDNDAGSGTAFPREDVLKCAEAAKPFLEDVARSRSGGGEAVVRTIAQCGMSGTVAFSMLGPGSHHCENIGRPHKSNHIFFVVDFVQGMFCQKCHDHDCSGYRSAWMPLPHHLKLVAEPVMGR